MSSPSQQPAPSPAPAPRAAVPPLTSNPWAVDAADDPFSALPPSPVRAPSSARPPLPADNASLSLPAAALWGDDPAAWHDALGGTASSSSSSGAGSDREYHHGAGSDHENDDDADLGVLPAAPVPRAPRVLPSLAQAEAAVIGAAAADAATKIYLANHPPPLDLALLGHAAWQGPLDVAAPWTTDTHAAADGNDDNASDSEDDSDDGSNSDGSDQDTASAASASTAAADRDQARPSGTASKGASACDTLRDAPHATVPSPASKTSTIDARLWSATASSSSSSAPSTPRPASALFSPRVSSLSTSSIGNRPATPHDDNDTMPDESSLNPKALFTDPQKLAYAALVYLAVQQGYDHFDAIQFKSVHVALQSYGVWATKLLARLHAHLHVAPQEQRMIENLVKHGIEPFDVAAALIPNDVLDQWKLDRKREREEALRKQDEEERRAQRELEMEARRKRKSDRKKKKAARKVASPRPNGTASTEPADQGAGKRPDTADSDDDVVPLPEYAALPGDNYFPNQPQEQPVASDSDSDGDDDDGSDGRTTSHSPSRPRAASTVTPHRSPSAKRSPSRPRASSDAGSSARSATPTAAPPPATTAAPRAMPAVSLSRSDVRHAALADLVVVCVGAGHHHYDARSRVLVHSIGAWLLVPPLEVVSVECSFAQQLGLLDGVASAAGRDFDRDYKARSKRDRGKRIAAMAAAAVGGGLALGLSAGLAAPLIGAGLGAAFTGVGLTGTTSFLSGTGGVALITTGATLTGSRVAQTKMAKRTRGISDFTFLPVHEGRHMNVVITMGGWLAKTDEKNEDIALPFSLLDTAHGDHYSILWEPDELRELGSALKMIAGEVISTAVQQALMVTMLHSLLAALAWPLALLKIGYLIDNPWQNALARSKKAGQLLADLLMQQVQEGRPVTLVGYSLGARALLYCLLELAANHGHGLVQDVYLFGCPATPSREQWALARSVVAGKFVNGYVKNDWILGFLFRASAGFGAVAGLAPTSAHGVEDLDLTGLVNGHLAYRVTMPRILERVGLAGADAGAVAVSDGAHGVQGNAVDLDFMVRKDRETEHKQEEQSRIARERSELEAAAKRRTGKDDVLLHLQLATGGDSLTVMSRVNHDAADLVPLADLQAGMQPHVAAGLAAYVPLTPVPAAGIQGQQQMTRPPVGQQQQQQMQKKPV
ncbi:hypothetical protein AMAG_11478 [Allomyces macrogynus ATCC 38327]|uniref:DUF726 domain-containing protein n=1 Tax=Allomyces macrogynus (strain ATCC 38327) TaxID=578462 RepID=A0A0L0SWU1_ALLM3|nr:hypothetical protein AMAG_11478 [Allomyces macrogynus ATCC 38327]|eukprot:KNE67013.1 hypothetical protein AMAG_11478 [Allomyces macrogynus ATCC 38327]